MWYSGELFIEYKAEGKNNIVSDAGGVLEVKILNNLTAFWHIILSNTSMADSMKDTQS